ncbi:MAG: hypothetical protein DMF49_11575 [Acidobacteria bacterium]|nr:MAG: hypothetical protein DMF49_11575 [Acidobacteriota bacterium]
MWEQPPDGDAAVPDACGQGPLRALEGCAAAHGGRLAAGEGETGLRIGPGLCRRVVDGLLTGMHERETSHHELLLAFAERALVERAHAAAAAAGYLTHEFGDRCLILEDHPDPRRRDTPSPGRDA